jgi:exonuclease VII small subunit
MVDPKTIEDIVTALSKIVERLNTTETRLRSLEEATTTALKRLSLLEDEIKRANRSWSDRADDMAQRIETLSVKYLELAKARERLEIATKSNAQKSEIERLRTLVEVLR